MYSTMLSFQKTCMCTLNCNRLLCYNNFKILLSIQCMYYEKNKAVISSESNSLFFPT